MADTFVIADHYRGLLIEFASEVCSGRHSNSSRVDMPEMLRPTPVSDVRCCVERLMSVRSPIPMAWRLGDFLAASGRDLIMARVMASRNIGDALETIQANHCLFTNIRTVAHRAGRGNDLAVIHRKASIDDPVIGFLFQVTVAGKLARMFSIYTGSAKQKEVDLAAPSFGHLLERLSRELDFLKLDYRDDEIAVELTTNVLTHRISDVDDQVVAAIDHELQRKAAKLPANGSLKDQIKYHLRSNNFAEVSLDEVCETFRIHRRTLTRLLRNERTTFTNILKDLRRERAIHLVQHTNVPLKRIAAELGFNSDASFCMAFKSWTGEAPKRYRTSASWRARANDLERSEDALAS